MAPKKEYFELLDQPAAINPYTLSPIRAIIYNIPRLKSTSIQPYMGVNKTHPNRFSNNMNIGPIINNHTLARDGKLVSFKINFKASVIGCPIPHGPTILGPLRF